MPTYSYKAIDATGQEQQGVIESDSERQTRDQLRARGLLPIEVESTESRVKHNATRGINAKNLMLITRHLAALVSSGIPIDESLSTIIEQTEVAKIKNILLAVRNRLREGYALHQALRHYPQVFSSLYCALIKTGEQTGKLDHILEKLADYLEKQYEIKHKITQALLYPLFLTIIATIIISGLLTYVVPKMVDAFLETGQSLPWPTVALIKLSHGLVHYGIYLLVLTVMIAWSIKRLYAQSHTREKIQTLLLRIPLLKHLLLQINTTRFLATATLLAQAGVDLLLILQTSNEVIFNMPIKKALINARDRITAGVPLYLALKETQYFSPLCVQLIMSGEKSGRLSEMLNHAARQQTYTLQRYLDTILALFEPCLILLMGSIVLFIVLAVLLPVFSADQLVQLR